MKRRSFLKILSFTPALAVVPKLHAKEIEPIIEPNVAGPEMTATEVIERRKTAYAEAFDKESQVLAKQDIKNRTM